MTSKLFKVVSELLMLVDSPVTIGQLEDIISEWGTDNHSFSVTFDGDVWVVAEWVGEGAPERPRYVEWRETSEAGIWRHLIAEPASLDHSATVLGKHITASVASVSDGYLAEIRVNGIPADGWDSKHETYSAAMLACPDLLTDYLQGCVDAAQDALEHDAYRDALLALLGEEEAAAPVAEVDPMQALFAGATSVVVIMDYHHAGRERNWGYNRFFVLKDGQNVTKAFCDLSRDGTTYHTPKNKRGHGRYAHMGEAHVKSVIVERGGMSRDSVQTWTVEKLV